MQSFYPRCPEIKRSRNPIAPQANGAIETADQANPRANPMMPRSNAIRHPRHPKCEKGRDERAVDQANPSPLMPDQCESRHPIARAPKANGAGMNAGPSCSINPFHPHDAQIKPDRRPIHPTERIDEVRQANPSTQAFRSSFSLTQACPRDNAIDKCGPIENPLSKPSFS